MNLLSVYLMEPTKKKASNALTVRYAWPLISAKTLAWCLWDPDALVNMSVFCTAPRLKFCWEITAGFRGTIKTMGHETARTVF